MNDTKFEEAIKKAVQVCIGDDNDLIRRGDALNAIREMCRIGCLPSSALTQREQREVILFDALQAVRTVKKAAVPATNQKPQRPIGTWIVTKTIIRGVNRYECPFCGATRFRASAFRLNYCDDCGVKLGV